jgi:hypothetical protein
MEWDESSPSWQKFVVGFHPEPLQSSLHLHIWHLYDPFSLFSSYLCVGIPSGSSFGFYRLRLSKYVIKIHVVVFWVVTPSNVGVGYQRFGGCCRLHLQGEVIGEWSGCIPGDSVSRPVWSSYGTLCGSLTRFGLFWWDVWWYPQLCHLPEGNCDWVRFRVTFQLTVGQSVSQSWLRAPLGDSWSDFGCSQDSFGFVYCVTFSLMIGWVCHVMGSQSLSVLLLHTYVHFEFFMNIIQLPIQGVPGALSLG